MKLPPTPQQGPQPDPKQRIDSGANRHKRSYTVPHTQPVTTETIKKKPKYNPDPIQTALSSAEYALSTYKETLKEKITKQEKALEDTKEAEANPNTLAEKKQELIFLRKLECTIDGLFITTVIGKPVKLKVCTHTKPMLQAQAYTDSVKLENLLVKISELQKLQTAVEDNRR